MSDAHSPEVILVIVIVNWLWEKTLHNSSSQTHLTVYIITDRIASLYLSLDVSLYLFCMMN